MGRKGHKETKGLKSILAQLNRIFLCRFVDEICGINQVEICGIDQDEMCGDNQYRYMKIGPENPIISQLHGLKSLKSLQLVAYSNRSNDSYVDCMIEFLCSPDCKFKETLELLSFYRNEHSWATNERRIDTLLFRVLPMFPNLHQLELHWESLIPLADCHQRNKPCTISKSLRTINFFHSSLANDSRTFIPGIHDGLLFLLKTFPTLDSINIMLSHDLYASVDFGFRKDVIYAILQNRAGRRLFEGSDSGDEICNVPLSLWPAILHRAHSRCCRYQCLELPPPPPGMPRLQPNFSIGDGATGMYYLLREAPALIFEK